MMVCDNELAESMFDGMRCEFSVEEYMGGCRIHTGFELMDGDEPWIVLKERDGGFILTDCGHTQGWLLNQLLEPTPARMQALEALVMANGTRLEGGRIVRDVGKDPAADFMLMLVTIISATNLVLLNRRTVRSTFLDDVKATFEKRFPECETGKILSTDKGERFRVDVYVDREKPLLVFGVRTKDRCKDASLAIMALSEDMEFESVAVVDGDAGIPKRDLELLRNRAGHVMTLDEARSAQLR